MTNETLTSYRESATAAKAGVLAMPSFITVPDIAKKFIYTDIPTLATAVVDLCAEVERLQDEHGNLTMLVRRLCLVCKSEKLTKHAVDYLKRKELYHGSILRIEGDA